MIINMNLQHKQGILTFHAGKMHDFQAYSQKMLLRFTGIKKRKAEITSILPY